MTSRIPGLCGLALAGGGATRMGGGDKPLLALGDRPMLAYVLDALAAEAEAVAISANGDPARFAAFGLPVLDDGDFAGRGPLAGVLAGLDWAASRGATALLTIPGDTPFVPAGLATALWPAPACAMSGGQMHYLVALWPVAVRERLRRLLESSADPPGLCHRGHPAGPHLSRSAGEVATHRVAGEGGGPASGGEGEADLVPQFQRRTRTISTRTISTGSFAGRIGMRAVEFATAPRDPFLNVNTPDDLATARASPGRTA